MTNTKPTIPGNSLAGPLPLGTVVPSLIRTYVPVAIGQLVSWLVVWGVVSNEVITQDQQAAVSAALGAVLTGAYYTVVRLAETRWPQVGILLGTTQQPVDYARGADVVSGEVVASYVHHNAEEWGTNPDGPDVLPPGA